MFNILELQMHIFKSTLLYQQAYLDMYINFNNCGKYVPIRRSK